MFKTYSKIVVFALFLIGFFVFIGEALTRISGQRAAPASAVGVNPEAGEAIFWGKGKCGTCHRIGNQGSAVRCPDLGNMGTRAHERAAERAAQNGKKLSATEYLIESIAEPSAYVVANYKNEMPRVYEPPIALKPEEIQASISYLQSLGGEVDVSVIKLPDKILRASAEPATPWEPYLVGDVEEGEYIFFDPESVAGCGQCHAVVDSIGTARGGQVGPELSHIAGTRTPQFIVTSILDPSAEIASGFEQVLIITNAGVYLDGIPVREDENSITIKKRQDGEIVEVTIAKSEIKTLAPQSTSMMPGNLAHLLTMQQFHDILAYLMTLK
ncbi:MAG: c-type cytochrome [Bacteroidota bacterium]